MNITNLDDKKVLDLINEADFVSTFFLSLVGCKPSKSEKIILNAILVSTVGYSIDLFGSDIISASQVLKEVDSGGDNIEVSSQKLIESYISENKQISGFGHPIYKEVDPRAKALFDLARKNNLDIKFMNISKQLEHSLEDKLGKKLVLNINGAVASLLMTMGIDPVVESIARIFEKQKLGKWVRQMRDESVDGAEI